MNTDAVLNLLYAVAPNSAPWPVALFMLLAASYLGFRLWKLLWS
jgi:hypothetical protein